MDRTQNQLRIMGPPTSARFFIPMVGTSYFLQTSINPKDGLSISTSLISMERGRSALPSIQDLIPFPCSVRMGSDWSSSLIEIRNNPVNLIYSLLTGFLKLIRNRLPHRV